MKILILSRYSYLGSSSRYRIYQYIPYLKARGWEIELHALLNDNYIHHLYKKTPLPFGEIIKSYFKRLMLLLDSKNYDLIWLQQEAFPWIPPFIETFLLKSKTPVVVDHDDAFFHRYDMNESGIVRNILGDKIDRTMKISETVIAGNSYLADRAAKNNCKNIKIVPTVIDITKYKLKNDERNAEDKFIIGWVGSPPNSRYLNNIDRALKQFCDLCDGKLHLVGAGELFAAAFPFKNIAWNEETEVDEIRNFDVGIMPLIDSEWERGKCGFKLIQYMACGIPVIASPVGVNKEIVVNNVNGFLAESDEDWIKYLKILKNNPELRKQMGTNGRKLAEEKFTLQVNAPILAQYLHEAAISR